MADYPLPLYSGLRPHPLPLPAPLAAGKVMHIKRRVASKTCFNGPDFARGLPHNETCNCTLQDVECDYGYIRGAGWSCAAGARYVGTVLFGRAGCVWVLAHPCLPPLPFCSPLSHLVPAYSHFASPLLLLHLAGGKCSVIPHDRMPVCPVIDSHLYSVSDTGLRMVHGDVCTGIDVIIADTDGKVRWPEVWMCCFTVGRTSCTGNQPSILSPCSHSAHSFWI